MDYDSYWTTSRARLLIENGADTEIANKRGETAFDLTESLKMKKLLFKHAKSFSKKLRWALSAPVWPF